jgi:hypothetical protein
VKESEGVAQYKQIVAIRRVRLCDPFLLIYLSLFLSCMIVALGLNLITFQCLLRKKTNKRKPTKLIGCITAIHQMK